METNVIYNENCLDTMARMKDNFIDLVVTSPPYDGLRTYNGYSFPFEDIAKELYRVTKEGGVVVWNVSDSTINGSESLTSFKQAIYFVEECGFNLHDTMIYATNKPPQNSGRYEPEFEYMFVFSKGKPKTFNPIKRKRKWDDKRKEKACHREKTGEIVKKQKVNVDECTIGNIWYYETGGGHTTKDKIAFEHPAIFPDLLAYDHILSWTNKGDLVYDCFMGSGTTAIACLNTNRLFIVMEQEQKYYDIILKRVGDFNKNFEPQTLFGNEM